MLAVHIPHTHDAYLTNTGTVGATATCRTREAGGKKQKQWTCTYYALCTFKSAVRHQNLLCIDTKDASIPRNRIPTIMGPLIDKRSGVVNLWPAPLRAFSRLLERQILGGGIAGTLRALRSVA